ncbi:transposon Tf2-6 polyprotein [Nephila pilipes]|uniref:Transposon Tf2-6 polyprotein n=1 Tax=Nephila pilipes TaxID=299642 RepID=A0A8X6Q307_NEPPI|nr:transposon Tf2-6 polyprotein [Nephila pilipes]
MNIPENELDVYIDSVIVNETKCEMITFTDSIDENIEMVSETTCIISKNELIKQYKDVFTGIGEFPREPYHITLKNNSVPVIHPPKRVPQALQPKLKSTLNNLEKEGIVSKVNKPTDWDQSLVIVEKPNGNLRLYLDSRDLNKVIKREHYQISCTDDIISRLEGKKIFSVVDLKDGFWHVPLDEKRNQKLFGDIEGVEIYFDDIIVAGYNEDSHDVIMSKVLERARSLNIKFNPDKLQYRESEVKYVGQIIPKSGIIPDPGHIKAIVAMPTSKSKAEVRRLLGMFTKDGLGSCLIQKGQHVSFVSRSLTNSEKNYAQIEKELLAIVFSFEKFHNFVNGRKVAIQSDHKPLMAIVKRPMHKISSKMQRMILKLLKYDLEINYVPGNRMFLADTLSRVFPVNETVRDDPEMLNIVHTVSKHLPMSEKRQAQFKKETELDPELKIVVKYIKEG